MKANNTFKKFYVIARVLRFLNHSNVNSKPSDLLDSLDTTKWNVFTILCNAYINGHYNPSA